jgi:cell division septation protein DedD
LLPPPETPLARPVAPVNATPAEPPASGRASDTTQQQVSPTASPVPGESASSSARADASPAPTAPVASVAPPTLLAPRAELPDSIARAPEPPDPETLAETPARDLSEIAPAAGSPTRQATVAPPAPASASQAPAGPAWRIQLASLTSETRAQAELQRMQQANTDVLGGLALNVEQANLAKGTYYRIQAGPLADRGAATDLCTKLKARKLDCLVVAP